MHILLVDDNEILCCAFAQELKRIIARSSSEPTSIKLAFTFAAAAAALSDHPHPDIVFLDLNLNDSLGLIDTIAAFVKVNVDNVPVVVTGLSTRIANEREILRTCLRDFSVRGVLSTYAHLNEAFLGIARIVEGGVWFPEDVLMGLALTGAPVDHEYHLGLSPREWEVANLIVKGYPDKKIANELHLQPGYVRQVATQIFKKLKVPNRTAAAERLLRAPAGSMTVLEPPNVEQVRNIEDDTEALPILVTELSIITSVRQRFKMSLKNGTRCIITVLTLMTAVLITADQHMPPHFEEFIGTWGGFWDGILPSSFIVTSVTPTGEFRAVYGWGTSDKVPQIRSPGSVHIRGRVRGNELSWGDPSGVNFTFTLQPDGTFYGERWDHGRGSSVTMKKFAEE